MPISGVSLKAIESPNTMIGFSGTASAFLGAGAMEKPARAILPVERIEPSEAIVPAEERKQLLESLCASRHYDQKHRHHCHFRSDQHAGR